MTKSERSPKPEIRTWRLSLVTFGLRISNPGFRSLLGIRNSDFIRHLEFVIGHSYRLHPCYPENGSSNRETRNKRKEKELSGQRLSPVGSIGHRLQSVLVSCGSR